MGPVGGFSVPNWILEKATVKDRLYPQHPLLGTPQFWRQTESTLIGGGGGKRESKICIVQSHRCALVPFPQPGPSARPTFLILAQFPRKHPSAGLVTGSHFIYIHTLLNQHGGLCLFQAVGSWRTGRRWGGGDIPQHTWPFVSGEVGRVRRFQLPGF